MAPAIDSPHDFAVFNYGHKIVRGALWQFKYHHNASAIKILTNHSIPYIAEYLSETLHNTSVEQLVLVPIPQHLSKKKSRGYNQSLLLAKWIAERLEGATIGDLLIKSVPTTPQARLKNKKARMTNVIRTMHSKQILDPKSIYIIIDDVMTTRATVNEARRALRQNGAKKVLSVTLAHGYVSS